MYILYNGSIQVKPECSIYIYLRSKDEVVWYLLVNLYMNIIYRNIYN